SRPVTYSRRGMMSVRVLQNLRAPSTPSFSSVFWNWGRNAFMLVVLLMFRKSRQRTSMSATRDMPSIGKAKNQCSVKKSFKACMAAYPAGQERFVVTAFMRPSRRDRMNAVTTSAKGRCSFYLCTCVCRPSPGQKELACDGLPLPRERLFGAAGASLPLPPVLPDSVPGEGLFGASSKGSLAMEAVLDQTKGYVPRVGGLEPNESRTLADAEPSDLEPRYHHELRAALDPGRYRRQHRVGRPCGVHHALAGSGRQSQQSERQLSRE